MSNKNKHISTTNRKVPLRLKKVTSLMLASAVLSSVSLHAAAQALNKNLAGNIDGGMNTGYLITGDSRFQGSSAVQIGNTNDQSLVHSFRTVGGAGSGGGAALGGAFFVDADASLTVINTDFANNRAQGGNGGSVAPVSYAGQLLNIIGRNVELNQLPATQVDLVLEGSNRFTRSVSNGVVTYGVTQVSVASDVASLLIKDAPTIFTDFNGNKTTTISNITSSGLVTLSSPVTTTATILPSFVAPNNPSPFIKTYEAVKDQQGNDTNQVIETVTTNRLFTGGTSGFTAVADTLNFGYGFNLKTVDEAVAQPPGQAPVMKPKMVLEAVDIPGAQAISQGDKVFIGVSGEPAQVLANVLDVIRFTPEEDAALNANNTLTGKPKAVVLDRPISPLASSIEVVKQPTFNVIPFAVNNQDRTLVQSFKPAATYLPGMSVTWESNGTTVTAKITEVIGGSQVRLDKPVPEGITDLKFVENPLTGDNTVRVTNAAATFKPGQVVYVPSTTQDTFVGVVKSVSGDLVEVEPENANQRLADFYDPNLGLGLKKSAAEVSNDKRTLTVPFNTAAYGSGVQAQQKISALLKDRLVKGSAFDDGTTVSNVVVGNGTVTITLSNAATTNVIENMILSSPLVMGGNMNGLTDKVARNNDLNGSDGYSANGASSFFNDAEGVDGTNGAGAKDNEGGAGYNGGKGGNGSNGLPVNFWLVYDTTVAGIQMKQATRNLVVAGEEFVKAGTDLVNKLAELAGVAAPDPQAGLGFTAPDPLEIIAAGDQVKSEVQELRLKTKNLINAKFDIAWAISDLTLATTNLGKWATELGLGLAGLGGAGGDGGQASGGADFFGGGGGGAGGNGGAGAISISDGGDGGTGGMGGAGGFGAGGGQGGEGGLAGANGNASGGDPGEGGYAGFGAGQGANGDGLFGGGGSGLGGSIFVRSGGTLLIQGNSRFSNNNVAGGSTSSEFGEAGSEAGTDLFMMKGSSVRLQPGQGKTIQFDGTIADDSFGTNDGYQHAAGYGADLRIGGTGGNGGGLVVLNGENTYSGHTILEGATLSAELGMGVNDLSLIRFNGSGSTIVDIANNKVTQGLSIDSVGTLLLTDDFTRLAGTDPGETAWTGSGGFASGVKGLLTVNLGAINDQGLGQNLVWGSDGFFTTPSDGNGAANNGVLTFGSDYSEGWIEFTNNVNFAGKTARVAVYKNNNNYTASNATLSGNWVNSPSSVLLVGDSKSGTSYDGTLFMTGQNELDNVVVAGGTLSTYNKDGAHGKLFKPAANLVVLADKDNTKAKTHLQLFSAETLANVSVLLGGNLTLNHRLTVSGNFDNKGDLRIYGSEFASLSDEQKESRIAAAGMSDYLASDFSDWLGELRVTGNFVNSGRIDQLGGISAGSIITVADSIWNSKGNLSTTLDFVNSGALLTEGNIGSGRDVLNSGILGLTGNLSAVRDLINSGAAEVVGDVTVGRDLLNNSSSLIDVSGVLTVGHDLSNNGALDAGSVVVTDGDFVNTGVADIKNNLNVSAGVLNNLGAVTVGEGASIGTNLTNAAEKSFDVLSGGLTVGGFVSNAGTVEVVGSTAVGTDLTNSSTGSFSIDQGALSVTGAMDNAGVATIDGKTTVGASLTNSNTVVVKQGGLVVGNGANGGALVNQGEVIVSGNSSVTGDLINHNTNGNTLAILSIDKDAQNQGTLTVGGNFDNRGTAVVSGKTTVVSNLSNSQGAGLTVKNGGAEVGGSFTNDGAALLNGGAVVGGAFTNNGTALLNGEVTVADQAHNTGSLTVNGGGLKVEKSFDNQGTSVVEGSSLVRFDLTNSGSSTFGNSLQVVGSFKNNGGTSVVDGAATVGFDLINTAGAATFNNNVSVGGRLQNLGASAMQVTGNVNVGTELTNERALSIVGNTTVTTGSVTNTATGGLLMTGDLSTAATQMVTNNGYWGVGKDSVISTGTLQGSNSGAVFCLSSLHNSNCSGDNTTATQLTLNLASSSSSIFKGVFAGAGSLVKSGASDLLLESDQTFSGGLTINAGSLIAAGKLNDGLDVVVNGGSYVVATADTIRSVVNNAPRSVHLHADLTTTEGFQNNGRLVIDYPTLVVDSSGSRLERTLNAGSQGFSGSVAGTVEISEDTNFRLIQSGDSEYAGTMSRGNDASALIKEGVGSLTLSNTINLKYITIKEGEIKLAAGGILASDAIVDVNMGTKLSLLSGNQSIHQLLGSGTLNLGANNLSIEDGGEFTGVISGTGQVSVNSGSFAINGSLNTTDSDFVVNDGSSTFLANDAKLNVNKLDVKGTLSLGSAGGTTAEINAASGVDVFGTLQGGGVVQGPTRIRAGGNLKPGYSPGILTFSNGLQLESGSTTTMEILDPAQEAGLGFDQLVIGAGSTFSIMNGAKLSIKDFGMASPLTLGRTVNLFNFAKGSVRGVFGEVTADEAMGIGAISLATGNVVGLGSATMSQIRNAAVTDNEKAIYNGLLQSSAGDVAQFYGGQFIEKLIQNSNAGPAATKAVFTAYNPESYMGLSDASLAATQEAFPAWKSSYLNQERLIAFAGNSIKATSTDGDQQTFGLGVRSLTVGGARQFGDKSVIFTLGGVDTNLNSRTVTSSGNGFTAGLALLGAARFLPNTVWFTGLSHSNLQLNGRRINLNGGATFDGVDSHTSKVEIGLEKRAQFDSSYLMMRGALAAGSTTRGRVNEVGSVNSLDTMSVHASRYGFKMMDVGLEIGGNIDTLSQWYGSVNYQVGNLGTNTVRAGFDNDQAIVNVEARSAMRSNSSLMMGLRHQYANDVRLDASIGLAKSWERMSNVLGRVTLSKSF